MTNNQLLLLAANNLSNKMELSHSQASYIYQFYYTHVANQYANIPDFMAGFMSQMTDSMSCNFISVPQEQIYLTIAQYLAIAEERYIERQRLLQKRKK